MYCQEHADSKSAPTKWVVYQSREMIEGLIDHLNKNGKREAALSNSLRNLIKEEYIEFAAPKKGASSSSQTVEEEIHEREQAGDILNNLLEYESIYQPEEDYLKGKSRINRNLHLLEIFRDRIHKTPLTDRATSTFLLQLLLDLEQEFSNYLRSRKCRWIGRLQHDT